MKLLFISILVYTLAVRQLRSKELKLKSNLNGKSLNNTLLVSADPSTSSCNVTYAKVGCYDEMSSINASFPDLLLTDTLPLVNSGAKWSLRSMPWDSLLDSIVCKCAKKTAQKRYNFFGIKNYDQCWSGETTSYYQKQPSENCLQFGLKNCEKNSTAYCVGSENSVFVYKMMQGVRTIHDGTH